MQQSTFEKKLATVRGMLTKQIFELREPRLPGRIYVLLQLVIFMTKQYSPRKIFDWIVIYR